MPSRYTGTPVRRSDATVKSAVHSISVGSVNSPNGTANSRNASGKAKDRANRQPSSAISPAWSMNTSANCRPAFTTASCETSHSAPAQSSASSAGRNGRIAMASKRCRSRQPSHSAIGTTTNPCANVSLRSHVSSIVHAVRQ